MLRFYLFGTLLLLISLGLLAFAATHADTRFPYSLVR
jgi:hypothetical protein